MKLSRVICNTSNNMFCRHWHTDSKMLHDNILPEHSDILYFLEYSPGLKLNPVSNCPQGNLPIQINTSYCNSLNFNPFSISTRLFRAMKLIEPWGSNWGFTYEPFDHTQYWIRNNMSFRSTQFWSHWDLPNIRCDYYSFSLLCDHMSSFIQSGFKFRIWTLTRALAWALNVVSEHQEQIQRGATSEVAVFYLRASDAICIFNHGFGASHMKQMYRRDQSLLVLTSG